MEQIILVNENDEQIGLMEKLEAHKKAFFIGLFQYLFLMIKGKCYYKKERLSNIIVPIYGQILVVAIQEIKRVWKMHAKEDCLRKWVFLLI